MSDHGDTQRVQLNQGREALAEHLFLVTYHFRPDMNWSVLPVSARALWYKKADAVLRVLAEHCDTQQVRTEIRDVIEQTTGEPIFPPTMDAVMAVVAPHLARADAAVKRALRFERERNHATARAERAEAKLAAARQQLNQVREQARLRLAAVDTSTRDFAHRLWTILDAPARPAKNAESERALMSDDLETSLRSKLDRGEISAADADAVREFATFLREAGPMPGQPGADRERRLRALARYDPESVVDLLMKVLVDRDAAIAYAEKAKRWLIDAAGSDVTDLLHSLDECTERAERAEESRDRLRASGEQHLTDLMTIADKNLARAQRAEGEMVAAAATLTVLREFIHPDQGNATTPFGDGERYVSVRDIEQVLRLNTPAGHDETGQR